MLRRANDGMQSVATDQMVDATLELKRQDRDVSNPLREG